MIFLITLITLRDNLEKMGQKMNPGVKMEKIVDEQLELDAMTLAWEARAAAARGDHKTAKEKRTQMNAIYDDLEKRLDEKRNQGSE
jgi:hypothetical protein